MGFQSLADISKYGQYKLTECPLTYSIVGGYHNAGGKLINFRILTRLAAEVNFNAGDCVDVLWDAERGVGRLERSAVKGWRLTVTAKRNGINSYRIVMTYSDRFGLPDVGKQVGCEIVEIGDGFIEFRLNVDDGDFEDAPDYKLAEKPTDDGPGFTPCVTA
jgi:hypothetical protein